MKYLILFLVFASPAYAACDFNNDLCRPNPLMDSNERRLEDMERQIRQQSNSNQEDELQDQNQTQSGTRNR